MSNGDDTPSAASSPTTPGATASASASASTKKTSKVSKPRLSASQKNFNHKDAENKRRTAIRDRFTELSQLVPGALGMERSEQLMLNKTSEFLKELITEQRQLEALAEEKGLRIEDERRLRDDDFGSERWRQPNMEAYEQDKVKKLAKTGGRDGKADDDDDESNYLHGV